MTIDICSIWAYDDMKASGQLGKRQAQFLYPFANTKKPYTKREATQYVERYFNTICITSNGRITELEEMGYLIKVDKIKCPYTNQTVNRWKWTGRKTPFPKKTIKVPCECKGTGLVTKEIYYDPDVRRGVFDEIPDNVI